MERIRVDAPFEFEIPIPAAVPPSGTAGAKRNPVRTELAKPRRAHR